MTSSPPHSAPQDAPCPKQGCGSSADPRFTFPVSRFTAPLICILLALLCLFGVACSTTDQNRKIIFEDERGVVSLQTMPDESIHAAHPVSLEPALVAQVLRGMAVQYQERGLQGLISGSWAPTPVFSEDQIQFLAPLIAEGLRTAAPDQRIEYRALATQEGSSFLESSTTETTSGSLYAYGRQLYITLSQYRSAPKRTNINVGDMSYRNLPPDSSGLKNHIVLFTPSAAQRSDAFDAPESEKPTDRFLAVDYELLQHAPAASTGRTGTQTERTSRVREAPAGTGAAEGPSPSTEALAQEVEALKKEMQSLKQQQLGNQKPQQK